MIEVKRDEDILSLSALMYHTIVICGCYVGILEENYSRSWARVFLILSFLKTVYTDNGNEINKYVPQQLQMH